MNQKIKNVIIPGKALSELNKIMSDSDEDIDIFFASNQVLFRVGNINFISRLLEGHYPDTTRLFPENYEIKLELTMETSIMQLIVHLY